MTACVQSTDVSGQTDADNGPVAVVFGASGGIGAALTDGLRRRGLFRHVIGFSRHSHPAIDLLDEASLREAAAFAGSKGDIRLVMIATGFLHGERYKPEKSWRELDSSHMARSFAVNAIGPALIMKHILPLLPKGGRSIIAALSAKVGSIGDNQQGGWYGYRASKTALNQLVRTASIELRRQRPEAICAVLHPGTVGTRLAAPFRKSGLDVQPPALAAQRLLDVLERLGPDDSGGFFDHRGQPVPW